MRCGADATCPLGKEVKTMDFKVLYRGRTERGSSYYKVMVEIANGIWEDAVYFGNTTPKQITALRPYKDGWIAEIQKHTSRDLRTGQFKGRRVA